MQEVWKEIEGYEGISQISNFGRVKSFRYGEKMRVLKVSNAGYYTVALWKKGKATHCRIHKLVAQNFLQNTDEKPQVNHKDGNKLNNHVDNLEWCTASENTYHALRTGLRTPRKGESVNFAKLNRFQVTRIKLLREIQPQITQEKLGELFGVARTTVADILYHRTWKHVTI